MRISPLVDKIRNCQTRKLDAKSPSTSSILGTDPSVVGNTLLEKCRIGADHLCLLLQPFRRRFDDRSPPGRTMNGIVHTFETTSSGNTGLTGLGPSPTSATPQAFPRLGIAVSAKNGASHGPKQPMETYPAVKDLFWCVIPEPLTTVPATASPSPWTCSDHQGRDDIVESLLRMLV